MQKILDPVQALATAAQLITATIEEREEAFTTLMPTDDADKEAVFFSLIGIASHLAWGLSDNCDTTASEHVALAMLRCVNDYTMYRQGEETANAEL